jgi:hypothetical protein
MSARTSSGLLLVVALLTGCGTKKDTYAGLTPEAAKAKADRMISSRRLIPGLRFQRLASEEARMFLRPRGDPNGALADLG